MTKDAKEKRLAKYAVISMVVLSLLGMSVHFISIAKEAHEKEIYQQGYNDGAFDQKASMQEQLESHYSEGYKAGYDRATLDCASEFTYTNHIIESMSGSHTEETSKPESEEYVINTNTGKFHHPWCSSVDRISDWNREDVCCPREDIIDAGYEPCQRCNP